MTGPMVGNVGATRELGHHAAEGPVLIDRGLDDGGGMEKSSSTTAAAVSSQLVSMPRTNVTRPA